MGVFAISLSSFAERYPSKFLQELKADVERYVANQYEEDDDVDQCIAPILGDCFSDHTDEIFRDCDDHDDLEDFIIDRVEQWLTHQNHRLIVSQLVPS